jgi:Tfp pilus assembly protein PilF
MNPITAADIHCSAGSFRKAIERSPSYFGAHAMLAVVYIRMEKEKEARSAAAEVTRINPKFSLDWVVRT